MTDEIVKGWIDLGDQRLETRAVGPPPAEAPTLVMLHEGLDCADMWGEGLLKGLAADTGCGVVAYSRAGYGGSSPVALPPLPSFMHDEALKVLPRVLDAIGFRRGVLVGASDGSTIAAIYAGSVEDKRVRGISLTAPHFFVEEETAAGARAAKIAYEQGDLKRRLARWHTNVDCAFYTWNIAFSDPEFKRTWGITELLPRIRVPMQILQGERDAYGTPEQLATARRLCTCPLETTLLPGIGHSLHREVPEVMRREVGAFVSRVVDLP
jgi:pimeloyl-ACP methyl ester carboxylesterase